MDIQDVHHGGDNAIVRFVAEGNWSWDRWKQMLVRMFQALENSASFEVISKDYNYDVGRVVTDGVECRFEGKSFVVWSDLPNEVIIKFKGLRPRKAEALVQSLGEVWQSLGG